MKKHIGLGTIVAIFFLASLPLIAGMDFQEHLIKNNSRIQITGYSMYPTLIEQEAYNCEVCDSYGKGDIVVFQKDGAIIAHRIIEHINKKLVTKGEKNEFLDLLL